MLVGIFSDVEVDTAVGLVCKAIVYDRRDHLNLFHNVSRCRWLDGGGQNVEHPHDIVKVIRIPLHDLHGLDVFQPCFLSNLVFSIIGVPCKVSDIRDVPDIADLIAEVDEVAKHHIERQKGSDVAQVNVGVYRRATDIHAHIGWVDWNEPFLFSAERISNVQVLSEGTNAGFVGVLGVHVGAVSESLWPSDYKYRKAKTGPHQNGEPVFLVKCGRYRRPIGIKQDVVCQWERSTTCPVL